MAENKLKIASYWAASCGGCEIAVLDINEKILDVIQIADIVFWPVAMDIKYKDVENMPDKYIDVCFFNGGIRNSEQEHMAKLLRQKSKIKNPRRLRSMRPPRRSSRTSKFGQQERSFRKSLHDYIFNSQLRRDNAQNHCTC